MEKRGNQLGDAKGSLWEHLEQHGYDERYFGEHHLSLHRQRKRRAMGLAALAVLIVAVALSFVAFNKNSGVPTGNVVIEMKDGCCEDLCAQTLAAECSGTFHVGKYCREVDNCLVGCCIDVEDYCLTNYLKGNCLSKKGSFEKKRCQDNIFCKFGTDKPLVSRDEELRLRRLLNFSTGISAGVAYYGSSMMIRHVVSPPEHVSQVEALINKNNVLVAVVQLFDDGNHNDGAPDDGIFAQEWDTEGVSLSAGDLDIVELPMHIRITKADGVEIIPHAQTLTLLNGNVCFPLNYPPRNVDKRIAVIGEGYSSYVQYKQDVSYFLSRLFSSGNLSLHLADTDVHRVDIMDMGDLSVATTHCRWFNGSRDTLIILKRGIVCEQQPPTPVVKVEPRTFLNVSIAEMNYRTFENFCTYVKTERQVIDELVEQIRGPRAVFAQGHNSTVNSTVANVTFSIVYGFRPVTYEVYVNTQVDPDTLQPIVLASGTSNDETPIKVDIPGLWYGEHVVQVKAMWRRWSTRWSSHTLNVTVDYNENPNEESEPGGI
jgi:hypothetical protein